MNAPILTRAPATDAPFTHLILAAFATFGTGLLAIIGGISFAVLVLPTVVFSVCLWICKGALKPQSWASLWFSSSLGIVFSGILIGSWLSVLFSSWWLLLPGSLAIVCVFALVLRAESLPKGAEATLWGWMFVFPALLGLTVWHFAPAIYAFAMSFLHDYKIINRPIWGGLENYLALAVDPNFWKSLLNSFWYVLGTVPVGILIASLIAILLNENVRGLGLFRTIYFLPYITALTAAAAVWKWIYNPEFGLLNALLRTPGATWLDNPNGIFQLLGNVVHLELPSALQGPSVALCSVMVMSVWHQLGYSVVILLAGLQTIPKEYYEAASLDGATWWDGVRYITWSLLSPTTFFLAVTGLIAAFQVFTQILVLTPTGGVLGDTTTVVKYLYDKGFRDNNYSYASAMAFALFVVVVILSTIQNRVLAKRVTYEL
jgi:multiple sugar transport system permease protein